MARSKIPQLNEKMGSVRNLISNFEKPVPNTVETNKPSHGLSTLLSTVHEAEYIEESNNVVKELEHVTDKEDGKIHETGQLNSTELVTEALDFRANISINSSTKSEGVSMLSTSDHLSNILNGYNKEDDDFVKPREGTSTEISYSPPESDPKLVEFNALQKTTALPPSSAISNKVNMESNDSNVEISQRDSIQELNDLSSSIYPSTEKPSRITSKVPESKAVRDSVVTNNISSSDTHTSKQLSEWDNGNFLKQFGIESETAGSKSNSVTIDNNPYRNIQPYNIGESSTNTSRAASSIKPFVDMNWQLGDIDGLEKVSSRSRSSNSTLLANNLGRRSTIVDEIDEHGEPKHSRKRSVSFKDEENRVFYQNDANDINDSNGDNPDDKDYNNDNESTSQTMNPWKYVCYGLIIATLIIYTATLTFKEVFTNSRPTVIMTESDVIEFFNRTSNHTRLYLLENLSKKYEFTPTDSKQTSLYHGDSVKPKKIQYGPREHDMNVQVVFNSFENINPVYQNDSEIAKLMKDDNLKFMFSGMSYAPKHVMEPNCGANLREVILDIARLSKVTGSVKTYGTQCNQAEYILQAIKELNVNLTLSMGVWISNDDIINDKQISEMKRLLTDYPRYMFKSIFIGNEVIYRQDKTIDQLLEYIKDTKDYLQTLNITDLPVGTSELGSKIDKRMFNECDFVGANIHPFFAGVDATFGTRWTLDYYYNELLSSIKETGSDSKIIISEIGWPYQGGEFMKSVAGSWEFQQFLNDWLCTTPAEILNECFYFEAFDEPWKSIWWEGDRTWETEWGFFDQNRQLKKHIYMPDCSRYGSPSMVDFEYIESPGDTYLSKDEF